MQADRPWFRDSVDLQGQSSVHASTLHALLEQQSQQLDQGLYKEMVSAGQVFSKVQELVKASSNVGPSSAL